MFRRKRRKDDVIRGQQEEIAGENGVPSPMTRPNGSLTRPSKVPLNSSTLLERTGQ